MRRLLLALVLAGGLATSASAATFTAVPANLPSHETPNGPGAITVPFSLASPPPVPEQRSYQQLEALWKSAGEAYGVPWQVLAAINKIESGFGRNMGPSSAGAIGWMQFMPSSWMRWGMDANGDGVASPWNPEDAVYASARYLAAAGAHDDISRAIFAYNHADWYVEDVLELAQLFDSGGVPFDASLAFGSESGAPRVFALDDVEAQLADARRAVARAQRAVNAAEKDVERAGWRTLAAEQRAGDPKLTNAEFLRLEDEVTKLVLAQERAEHVLEERRTALSDAIGALETLRGEAQASAGAVAFSRPLLNGAAAPQWNGEYVFPVGGGPEVVSVSHTHHDYPAADVVAPEGSPLYALADAVVVETYPTPSGRCGIGLKLELATGTGYVYCHLSYLEAGIAPGRVVSAGTPVGLVGSTGNSTGPHLHLQLTPTSHYPQDEPWFPAFAGVAFRWSDEAPKDASETGPIFQVVASS